MSSVQILDTINCPQDLHNLSHVELEDLAEEIRQLIMEVVSKNGGHLASNLGIVELTLALHKVFRSPHDKIIWDVGHQCYTHKLITGRKNRFHTLRTLDGMSGFPKPEESPHDIVETGHASTSISVALGILAGQKLTGAGGKVLAVIGDGALTGGVALEALNQAAGFGNDLIIILNDNKKSISDNVGAISYYLSRLTVTRLYQSFRKKFDRAVEQIPWVGRDLMQAIYRLKKGLKALFFRETLFSDLGLEYFGPIDGHNLRQLVRILNDVKKLEKPSVVHVCTVKGKGYVPAEGDPTLYHGVSPFSIVDGKLETKDAPTFTEAFSGSIADLAQEDERIVAITAAMADGTG
ncbi:MAG: 1-deoxy-D-xylulose-5-phosphate synthase, partial [Spirochaetales bacterium]|nr:1-deoxy-D-xylulose-5-phosphate synthase [Spirochaetales bacterium]